MIPKRYTSEFALTFAALALTLTPPLTARAAAKISLDRKTSRHCLKVLNEGFRSDEFWPSIHAAEALTLSGYRKAVQKRLGPLLEAEKDDQKRCGLAREFARAGDSAKTRVMMKILEGEDDYGKVHAAESLYKVGWVGSSDPLTKAFSTKGGDVRLRLMAAAALGKRGDAAALAFIRATLDGAEDPDIYRIAAWVLGRIGGAADCDAIRRRIPDAPDAVTKAFLEHALAALGAADGKAALLRNLASGDAMLRTYAAVFAGEIGMSETKDQLIRQLDDANLDARIRAAQSLLALSR